MKKARLRRAFFIFIPNKDSKAESFAFGFCVAFSFLISSSIFSNQIFCPSLSSVLTLSSPAPRCHSEEVAAVTDEESRSVGSSVNSARAFPELREGIPPCFGPLWLFARHIDEISNPSSVSSWRHTFSPGRRLKIKCVALSEGRG